MADDNKKPKDNRIAREFGQRIKAIRKKLKMSQKDFAAHLGMKNNYLCEIELGHIKPGFDFFHKLTKQLKLNPYYLLHGEDQIFLKDETAAGENERNHIDRKPSALLNDPLIREMLWYMEHSRLIRFGVLECFTRYKMHNIEDVENELKKNNIKPPDHFE